MGGLWAGQAGPRRAWLPPSAAVQGLFSSEPGLPGPPRLSRGDQRLSDKGPPQLTQQPGNVRDRGPHQGAAGRTETGASPVTQQTRGHGNPGLGLRGCRVPLLWRASVQNIK